MIKFLNTVYFSGDMGRKQELEQELGEYIKGKRKKKIDVVGMIKGMMPKPSPPPIKLPPEIQLYGDEEEKKAEKKEDKKVDEVPAIETIEEAPKTEIEEYEAETKPLWHSILEKVGLKPSKAVKKEEAMLAEKGEEEKIKEMVEKEFMLKDIRDLAKMTLFVIKQLPKERMEQFKQTSDFNDLKELLKKYKLIK